MEIIVGIHGILNKHSRQVKGNFTICVDLQTQKLFQFFLGKRQGPKAKFCVFIQDDKMIYSTILDADPGLFPCSVIS